MNDFSERILCSDGNCIGIINERGVCNICGKPLTTEKKKKEQKDFDFSERILCSDGRCIGIINEKGICNICGKPLKKEEWSKNQDQRRKGKREENTRTEERTGEEKRDKRIDWCFEILGLKPGSSEGEVKQAYKDLVNVWHPDRFNNNARLQQKAQEKLKEINAAYEYIKSFYRVM